MQRRHGWVGTAAAIATLALPGAAGAAPKIATMIPANGSTKVSTNLTVALAPSKAVDTRTLVRHGLPTVWIAPRGKPGAANAVPADVTVDAGGSTIDIKPHACLGNGKRYVARVSAGLRSKGGAAFKPFTGTFTTAFTGEPACSPATLPYRFDVTQAWPPADAPMDEAFISLAFGPTGDHHLYATTADGRLLQFPVDADTGALGAPAALAVPPSPGQTAAAPQLAGLAFEPGSTPEDLRLWVVSNDGNLYSEGHVPADFSGGLDLLEGPADQFDDAHWTTRRLVTGLPRSVGDHETNSLAFARRDGAWHLYATQAANTAMGAPDAVWGDRSEHLLTAALLQVDHEALAARPIVDGPVSVNTAWTEDPSLDRVPAENDYSPWAPDAPVTLVATGLRNAFDLVPHDNGALYLATNGATDGGNVPSAPASPPDTCADRVDGAFPADESGLVGPLGVSAQSDFVFRVDLDDPDGAGPGGLGDYRPGGYYGAPDPARCELVMGAGYPSSGDPDLARKAVVLDYHAVNPGFVEADPNYRGYVLNGWLDRHVSPDGAIEYRSAAFDGTSAGSLSGAVVIAAYTRNQLLVLKPRSMQGVAGAAGRELQGAGSQTVIAPNLIHAPVDVVEDPGPAGDYASGRLYVTQLDPRGFFSIALLQPTP